MDPQTMSRDQIRDKAEATFPKPVLEYSEQTQYIDELKKQNEVLSSYDFVDQKNGVVRIPIDRAMDILAQRGLPVLPQGAGTGANAANAANGTGAAKTKAPNANAPKANPNGGQANSNAGNAPNGNSRAPRATAPPKK
jgi:hypothetical protein